jgi:hypothetical protein
MNTMQEICVKIIADPRYQRNLDWGEPREGHAEGTVREHIAELERNLERLRSRLTVDDYWKLKILIHTHDTFKAQAKPGTAITDPQSHASLARQFLSEFCPGEEDLLNMVQYHDEGHALWRQFAGRGVCNNERFARLLASIRDWDLFLWFNIIDNCTESKEQESLRWFIEEVNRHITTVVTVDLIP